MINCLFQLLRGHDDHVITCLEFCGSRVVSGSDDNTLKVWSVITGKVCNHSQTFSVACLINSSSLIDKCTICYTWNTVKYILFACNKYLRVSQLTLPQLPDIYRQWTQNALLEINIKKQLVLACKNYIQYNTCFKVNKIYIVFSMNFCSVSQCLRTLVGHTGGVWSSQMEDNIIISGSTDRTLKVWNADTGQCINTLYGHTSTVRCMHLHKNM